MLEVNTITDDRQMRALTGLDLATFCALAEPFAAGCQAEAAARFSGEQPPANAALVVGAKACWSVQSRNYCFCCFT